MVLEDRFLLLHFLPVHHISTRPIFVFTRPNDGWTGLYIKLWCLFSVHLRMEEKISLTAGRDGGLQNLEVHGFLMLRITDDTFGRVKVDITNNDSKGIQIQVRQSQIGA